MPSAVAGFLILAARRLPGWDSYERPVAADLKTSAQALAQGADAHGKERHGEFAQGCAGLLATRVWRPLPPSAAVSDTVVKKTARLDSIDFSFRVGTKGSWLPLPTRIGLVQVAKRVDDPRAVLAQGVVSVVHARGGRASGNGTAANSEPFASSPSDNARD